ncbi:hypothetical protein KW791_00305 [Candidatus Parcubacteria bacterium]|nr:hypothetical protein [Candidatus Parcubacteria bacterium]
MNWINKNIITNIFLILGGCAIAILGAEIVLRFLPSKAQDNFPVVRSVPESMLSYVLVPDPKTGVDKNGYINKDVLDKYNIVALGDSHTEGGYGETWPRHFSLISDKTVYNMGIRGYGPAQYYYLTDKALEFNPDSIFIGLYLGNDIFDAYNVVYHFPGWEQFKSADFEDYNPDLIGFLQPSIPFKDLRDFIREKSFLYKFLGERTRIWREQIGITKARTVGVDDWSVNDMDISLRFKTNPNTATVFWPGSRAKGTDLQSPSIQEGLRLTKKFLTLTNLKIKKSKPGTKLVVVIIPSKFSVYQKVTQESGKSNSLFSRVVSDESQIREEILALCSKERISCIDLLPGLQDDISNGKTLYKNTIDDHPDAPGYRAYAELVLNYLNHINK